MFRNVREYKGKRHYYEKIFVFHDVNLNLNHIENGIHKLIIYHCEINRKKKQRKKKQNDAI